MRLLIIAHAGSAGCKGAYSTTELLIVRFICKTLRDDVSIFISKCIHWIISKTVKKIPRPCVLTLNASMPNQILQFDFLFIGPRSASHKYVLVLKDDLSSYCWFSPCVLAESETAALKISRWIITLTVMKHWDSDKRTHLKNELLKKLAAEHNIRYKFSVAYTPWANGTVESVMRHVLSACRCLLCELRLAPHD